jgi:histone acetyltransferase (RNA polymerase elongator complex component)
VKDTPLEELFKKGEYTPQSLQDAVDLCAVLFGIFSGAGVRVLRMGLHPSEGFLNGTSLLAGPFHPAFGEMVLSKIWYDRILAKTNGEIGNELEVRVSPADLNAAIGHKAINKNLLRGNFTNVRFVSDLTIKKGDLHVDFY